MPITDFNTAVSTFTINQATTHMFRDLYIANTMLVLVEAGSKCVRPDDAETLDVHVGELLIFPSGTYITIENRVVSGQDYVAWCASYPDQMVSDVFDKASTNRDYPSAIHVGACPKDLKLLMKGLPALKQDVQLPDNIRWHRQLEPLIWLKSMGIQLTTPRERSLDRRVRDLMASDLTKKWRAQNVAQELGYSEPTFRRRMQDLNTSFSDILMTVRLEQALSLLQTTAQPISTIAMACGFSTPSHFSDAFKTRFEISPKYIRQSSH